MKKKIAEKWVKALRSGKYKQAIGKLKSVTGGYCCLGVLCNISKKGKWKKMKNEHCLSYLGASGYLPEEVTKWAEMKSLTGDYFSSPTYKKGLMRKRLSYQNDVGKSFKEIADIIEKNWKKL